MKRVETFVGELLFVLLVWLPVFVTVTVLEVVEFAPRVAREWIGS